MTKYDYGLALMLLGGIGCGAAPAENAEATPSAINEKTATPNAASADRAVADRAVASKVNEIPPSKGTNVPPPKGTACDPAPAPDPKAQPCAGQIAVAENNLSVAIKSGDAAQMSAAKNTLYAILSSCNPPKEPPKEDPCAGQIVKAQLNLDVAIKSGDAAQISAAKDTLYAVISSCNPPKGDPPKADPKVDPKGNACEDEITAIKAEVDEANRAGDSKRVTAAYERYDRLIASCYAGTCVGQIAAAKINYDEAVKGGDAAQISAAKEKYTAVVVSCSPTKTEPTTCAGQVAAAQANLDAGVKSGDATKISAAKEQYSAVVSKCSPTNGEAPKQEPAVDPKSDPCGPAFHALKADIHEALKLGDSQRWSADSEKYDALTASCYPGTCVGQAAAAKVIFNEAVKGGDAAQISEARANWTALVVSCAPAPTGNEPKKIN